MKKNNNPVKNISEEFFFFPVVRRIFLVDGGGEKGRLRGHSLVFTDNRWRGRRGSSGNKGIVFLLPAYREVRFSRLLQVGRGVITAEIYAVCACVRISVCVWAG